jgi:ankyrin repeat protein
VHRAAIKNQHAIASVLIENGGEVDMVDSNGRTALHWATFYGHLDTVKVLIDNDADQDIIDRANCTCASIAKTRKHILITEFLEQWKVDHPQPAE